MALGFKIADGYVEVHADYNKDELHRAAQKAADDFGSDKEHERGGREAGKSVSKGVTEGLSEEQRRSCTKEFHKRLGECFEKQESKQRGFGRRMLDRIQTGMTNRERVGNIAAAFASRFVEAVSFGQADFGMSRIGGPMAGKAAMLGATLGAGIAVALVAQVGNAITALLPLALGGALAAIPIADLIFRNVSMKKGKLSFKKSAIGQELKKFIREAQSLADGLGKVFAPTMLKGLKSAVTLFKQIEKPLSNAVKAISPGVLAMWRGLLGAVRSFGTAFAPALKGINAGLKEWGVQLPIIGGALGKMFSTILKDPALVRAAVQGLSRLLQGLLGFVGGLVKFLTVALGAWHNFWRVVGMGAGDFVNRILGLAPALGRISQAWKPLKKAILDVWDALKKFASATNDKQAAERMKTLVDKIKKAWEPLKKFLGTIFKEAWKKVEQVWNNTVLPWYHNVVVPWWSKTWPKLVRSAGQAIAKEAGIQFAILKAKAAAKLAELVLAAQKKMTDLKNKIVNGLKGLPTKLWQAGKDMIAGLAKGIGAGVQGAVDAAVRVAKAALAAAKGALGIKSPSTKFAKEVGEPIIQGLIVGFKKAEPAVAKWLKKFFDSIGGRSVTQQAAARLKALGKTFDKSLDSNLKKLDAVRDKLKALRQEAKDYAASIREAAVGDITQNINPANIVAGLQGRLAANTSFLAGLEQLKKLGLDKDALKQILDSGAETGNGFITALLGDPSQIAVVNALQKQLRSVGGKLGTFGSDTFYKSGVAGAVGLIKGLESQEKQLVKAIEKLAAKLVAAFKKKLGIHSPSTVAAEQVGRPFAEGVGVGMRKHLADEFKKLPSLMPSKPAMAAAGRPGRSVTNNHTFSPTIQVTIQAGLDPVDGAARRALVRGLHVELAKFQRSYA